MKSVVGGMAGALVVVWAALTPLQHPGLDASVIIEIPGEGHGSGTFIAPTKIITAKHVALMFKEGMRVRGPEGDIYNIIAIDNGPVDISILTVDRPLRAGTPRPVSCEKPYRGESLYYYGSPLNIEFIGPISLSVMGGEAVRVTDDDVNMNDVELVVGESEGGVSGSGVMNSRGELVGIYTMAWGETSFGGFVNLSDPTVCEFVQKNK